MKIEKNYKTIVFKGSFLFFFLLLFLWLFSLTDKTTILKIELNNESFSGYLNNQKLAEIKEPVGKIEDLEINFGNGNLPLPNPFVSQLKSVKFFNQKGEVARGIDQNIKLPRQINFSLSNLEVYSVEIKLDKCLFAEIKFNQTDNHYYRLIYEPFRERIFEVGYVENGIYQRKNGDWRRLSLSIFTSIKYLLYVILLPFPYFLAAMTAFAFLGELKRININSKTNFSLNFLKSWSKVLPVIYKPAVVLIFVSIFSYLVWVNITYVEKIPHDPDSVSYLWAGKYLAAGKLWLPPPSDFFKGHWLFNNRWVIIHPYGHPLALAAGVLLGAPWIIPPLLGTLFLVLLYLFLKEVFGRRIALPTTLIAFFSPEFQMHAVNFMSHNTAIFYLMFLLNFLHKLSLRKASYFHCLLGSACLILLFQTRPLAAVSAAIVSLVFFLILLLKRRIEFKKVLLFATSLLLLFVGVLYLNKLIYGHPINTPYNLISQSKFIWGGSGLTLAHGLVDSLSYLLTLRLIILPGLPTLFTLLILISLFNKNARWLTCLCLANVFLILIGTAAYDDPWGLFLGVRFWHEMLPFLFILIAIGLDLINKSFKKPIIGLGITAIIVILIGSKSINGWVFGKQKTWENLIYFTPTTINELKGFNFTNARLIKEAQRQNLHKALIFVESTDDWWSYGSVSNENSINFDSDIVWARDLGPKNQELINFYPGRKVFIADYDKKIIEPFPLFNN